MFSSARLQNLENIELINGDSGEYLSKNILDDQLYSFYLGTQRLALILK